MDSLEPEIYIFNMFSHRYENTLIYIAYVMMCVRRSWMCTDCKHVKETGTHRRFEQALSKLGIIKKTERLIIYFNKLS